LRSYIGHPYWGQRGDVIDIVKYSGMNRCKSEDKRQQALKGHLSKIGLTLEDFEDLQAKANRQWYRVDDDDQSSPIVVPRHQLAGCLVETIKRSPKSIRGKYSAESFRSHVQLSNFVTDKTVADGVYDRYVKLETSNQRNRQQNEYIGIGQEFCDGKNKKPVVAVGQLTLAAGVEPDELKHLMTFALSETGVGAGRKMGFGRGSIKSFELVE